MFSNQIGEINIFNCVKVTENDEYIIQLLNITNDRPVFMKYWQDESNVPRQGLLVLDSCDIFKADPEIVKLERIDVIPTWLKHVYVDPLQYILTDCIINQD